MNRADNERLAILKQSNNDSRERDTLESHNMTVGSGNSIHDHNEGVRKIHKRDTETEALIAELIGLDALIIKSVQASRTKLIKQNRELSEQVKAKEVYAQTSQIR